MKTENTINKIISPIAFLVLFLFNLSPAEAKLSRPIENKLARTEYMNILKKYKISTSDVSLQILSGEGENIFSIQEKTAKIPASVTKLFTAYAVLKKLTPRHRFYTKLYIKGNNLYLVGGGDPSFVSENMWFLVNEFKRNNINEISGNLIVDDQLFDQIRFDQSRQAKRVDRAYDSPVGALSFNWNSVNIFVRPNIDTGEKAIVHVDPENDMFELVNLTKTLPANEVKNDIDVKVSHSEKIVTVTGHVALGASEKAIFKPISEPDIWAGENLKAFLKQRGIIINGKVIKGSLPLNAELKATSESKSISNILADMNKVSNNFVAEMLTKQLAAQNTQEPASLSQGMDVINSEIKKLGVKSEEINLINPSGLTRENLFSAATLNKVLLNVRQDFSIFPTFAEGLPIAGVDGTLKKRMKGTVAEYWVRAKTGYLDGVVSLAGYAGRRNGEVLTFTFLYNGLRDESIVREAFDQMLIATVK